MLSDRIVHCPRLWQLDRAAEKAVIYERFATGHAQVFEVPPDRMGDSRYATVRVQGRYIPDRQILIDSMTHAGRAGYHVLTPLRIPGESRWLLVNRGWVAASSERAELPSVAVPRNERIVTGMMDQLPAPGWRLAARPADAPSTWPQVMLFPSFADLAEALEEPVYGYQLLLDPGAEDGLLRDWRPRVMGPNKHRAYAVQWFAFASVAAVLVVILNLRKERCDD